MTGKLLVIGGGEVEKKGSSFFSKLLSTVLKENSFHNPMIILPPPAAPASSKEKYEVIFKKSTGFCPKFIQLKENVNLRKKALDEASNADIIFFCGGQQLKYMDTLGSDFIKLVRERYKKDNLFVAGTSAGAMIFSKKMIASGGNEDVQVDESIKLAKGLNLLPNIIIDTHFIERGRFARLAHVIKKNPDFFGVGIEADTALLFEKEQSFKTYGCGTVMLFDGSKIKRVKGSNDDCVINLKIHLLSSGCTFSLDPFRLKH